MGQNSGWGGRIRTCAWRYQKPLPYRLATPQHGPDTAGADRHIAPVARKERSEEHTSELQSLMRISYAVFCLKKKKKTKNEQQIQLHKNDNTYNRQQPLDNNT